MSTSVAFDNLERQIQDCITARDYTSLAVLIDGKSSTKASTQARIHLANGILSAQKTAFSEALMHFLHGLRMAESHGDRLLEAQLHMNVGTVYARLQHISKAKEKYKYVLDHYRSEIDDRTRGALYHNYGLLQYNSESPQGSIDSLVEAIGIFEKLDATRELELARVLLQRSRLRIGEVMTSGVASKRDEFERYILFNRAWMHQSEGAIEEAIQDLSRCAELAEADADYYMTIECLELAIHLLKNTQQFDQITSAYESLLSARTRLSDKQKAARLIEQEVQFKIKEKEDELKLLRVENMLKKEIESRNRKLEVANEDLRQFAYVVSHDLKEPLRMIGGFTQLIQNSIEPDPEQSEYFNYISDGVDRLNLLLDELSKFSTLKSLMDQVEEVTLYELLEQVQNQLNSAIQDAGATIEIGASISMACSPTLIISCLQNLLHNGIKYARPEVPPHIKITASKSGDQSVIQIADNGMGIPEDQQERAFVIFQRIGNHKKLPGSGMGLAIAKRICQLHDGSIRIVSSSTEGTIFEIRLTDQIESTLED